MIAATTRSSSSPAWGRGGSGSRGFRGEDIFGVGANHTLQTDIQNESAGMKGTSLSTRC